MKVKKLKNKQEMKRYDKTADADLSKNMVPIINYKAW